MRYVEKPYDRNQLMVTSWDALVDVEDIVRIIDFFVESLDLSEYGFQKTEKAKEITPGNFIFEDKGGRPAYKPDDLLKLYFYGYRKNIRSSRKLAAACRENVSVIWLLGGLTPDFRTIADFRKDNIDCLRKVYKEFTKRVIVDQKTGDVSIDGSKFKAWNSKDRNFTITKIDDRIEWLKDHTAEYLRLLEIADENEDAEEQREGDLTREELERRLSEAKERLVRYEGYRKLMEENNLTQISLTDPDCRLMKNKNGMDTAYNIQTAVDTETHMVLDYKTTNNNTDHGLMAPTAEGIKEEAGDKVINVIADSGYEQPEDMIACLENGIVPNVVLPDGSDTKELEVEYVGDDNCDASSTKSDDIKRCLHNGVVPEVYEDIIEDMEIVEVSKTVVDEPSEMPTPYATEEAARERAHQGFFVRVPEADKVFCPSGMTLRHKSIRKDGATRYANKTACSKCPYRQKCVTGNSRWKEIDFGKDALERKAKWWVPEDPDDPGDPPKKRKKAKTHKEKAKVVRFKLRPNREKLDRRKCTSEHPFGTMKRSHDSGYFLLKGMRKVDGEFALISMGYNLSRAENMFTFDELMERVGRKTA